MDRSPQVCQAETAIQRGRIGVGLALAALVCGFASHVPAVSGTGPGVIQAGFVAGTFPPANGAGDLLTLKVETFDLAKFGPSSYGD